MSAENSDASATPKPLGTPFPAGVSGNPGGKPKNPFPALIRGKTEDGKKLVDVAFALLANPSWKAQAWACEFLRDTGWHKPVQPARNVDEDGNDVLAPLYFVPFNPAQNNQGDPGL